MRDGPKVDPVGALIDVAREELLELAPSAIARGPGWACVIRADHPRVELMPWASALLEVGLGAQAMSRVVGLPPAPAGCVRCIVVQDPRNAGPVLVDLLYILKRNP